MPCNQPRNYNCTKGLACCIFVAMPLHLSPSLHLKPPLCADSHVGVLQLSSTDCSLIKLPRQMLRCERKLGICERLGRPGHPLPRGAAASHAAPQHKCAHTTTASSSGGRLGRSAGAAGWGGRLGLKAGAEGWPPALRPVARRVGSRQDVDRGRAH